MTASLHRRRNHADVRFGVVDADLRLFGAVIGYMLPGLWLGRKTAQRQKEIRNGLPDALDLMIVCIEAGSGIDQALGRVAEELLIAYPALAREMEMIATASGRSGPWCRQRQAPRPPGRSRPHREWTPGAS